MVPLRLTLITPILLYATQHGHHAGMALASGHRVPVEFQLCSWYRLSSLRLRLAVMMSTTLCSHHWDEK